MPVITLQITTGVTKDQKRRIVEEFTDTLVRVANKKSEHLHIIIQEVPEENWGYAGMLTDAFRRTTND